MAPRVEHCPFCGGHDIGVGERYLGQGYTYKFHVFHFCRDCLAQGPDIVGESAEMSGYLKPREKEQLADLWNRRCLDEATTAYLAGVDLDEG